MPMPLLQQQKHRKSHLTPPESNKNSTPTMLEKSSSTSNLPNKISSKVLYCYNPSMKNIQDDALKVNTDDVVVVPKKEEDLETAVAGSAQVVDFLKEDKEQPTSLTTAARDLSKSLRSKSVVVSCDDDDKGLQEVDLEATNKADDAKVPIPFAEEEDDIENDDDVSVSFPKAFYCPLTNKVLVDPVVFPDGTTYEREAILRDETENGEPVSEDMIYPNRALKIIIDEARSRQGDSLQANLKRMQHSVSQRLGQLLEKSPIDVSNAATTLSDAFYCPITFNLMWDPVIDPEGNTFERVALENWIRVNKNSPITRSDLSVEQLYSNKAIYDLLQEEKDKPEELMDPAIRKWKEETPPVASDPEVGGNLEINAYDYPTTFSELDERQARRRRTVMNFFGIMFAILCLVGFVMYGGLILLMLFVVTLMLVFSKNRQDPRRR